MQACNWPLKERQESHVNKGSSIVKYSFKFAEISVKTLPEKLHA